MKTKFHSDGDVPPNKAIETDNVTLVVTAVFHENNKYYPKMFLDECYINYE